MVHLPEQGARDQFAGGAVSCWWKIGTCSFMGIALHLFVQQHWIQKLSTAGGNILHRFKYITCSGSITCQKREKAQTPIQSLAEIKVLGYDREGSISLLINIQDQNLPTICPSINIWLFLVWQITQVSDCKKKLL